MAYIPLTAEEMQTQASNEFQSYYDTLRQSAQQSYDTNDLLLSQQLQGLGATYGKQIESSVNDFNQAYSQSGREQLARGLGRSSYALQTLSNITQQGAEAKQTIMDAQAAAEANVQAQRTQLLAQLTEKVSGYDASQAADILKRISELENLQYERQYQAERDTTSDAQWQAEFDETVRQFNETLAKSKSSGGGGSGNTTPPADETIDDNSMTYEQIVAALSNITVNPNKLVQQVLPGIWNVNEEKDVSLDLSSVKSNLYNQPKSVQAARNVATKTMGR